MDSILWVGDHWRYGDQGAAWGKAGKVAALRCKAVSCTDIPSLRSNLQLVHVGRAKGKGYPGHCPGLGYSVAACRGPPAKEKARRVKERMPLLAALAHPLAFRATFSASNEGFRVQDRRRSRLHLHLLWSTQWRPLETLLLRRCAHRVIAWRRPRAARRCCTKPYHAKDIPHARVC